MWKFAANLSTEDEIRNCQQVQFHSKKIMNAFGKLVKAVSSGTDLNSLGLDRVGIAHYKYGVRPGDFRVNFLTIS